MKLKKKKVISLLATVLIIFAACSCGNNQTENKSDVLEGTWKLDNITKYTFDGGGNGNMTVSDTKYEFSYAINNDEVKIDFISEAAQDSVYEFNIDEGRLTLLSKDNNKGSYVLAKNN